MEVITFFLVSPNLSINSFCSHPLHRNSSAKPIDIHKKKAVIILPNGAPLYPRIFNIKNSEINKDSSKLIEFDKYLENNIKNLKITNVVKQKEEEIN